MSPSAGTAGAPDPKSGTASGAPWFGLPNPAREWRQDLTAVLFSRVIMFGVLYWAGGAFPQGSAPLSIVMVYGLSTVLFLATWVFFLRKQATPPTGFLLFFQFLVELCAETVVLVASGGYDSYHGFLFLLTIVSGGVFFGYSGALALAALASLIFGAIGFMHLGVSPLASLVALTPLPLAEVEIRFFLTTVLFFLLALLSSDGSRRLGMVRRELAGARQALNLAQFSAESMMQDLPTGILFFDNADCLRYHNRLAEQILDKDLGEGLGVEAAWEEILSPEALHKLILERPPSGYSEVEVLFGARPLRVMCKPLMREAEYLGCIFTVFDLTEEKRMERRLMRQERMAAVGQMSARIAHEIRNPLASISGAAQMLRDSPDVQGPDRRLFRLIVSESNRLNRFLSDLLEYVRERPPSFREIALGALFRRVIHLLEKAPAFQTGLVTFEEKVENGDVTVVTDQDLLLQVLLNVGLNALEAMEADGGRLIFAARRTQDAVGIEVMDSGPGMDAGVLARATEPFFTTKSQGTGLGLAVCAHTMQLLGGNINLTSIPGSGTTVSLTLPGEYQPTGNNPRGN